MSDTIRVTTAKEDFIRRQFADDPDLSIVIDDTLDAEPGYVIDTSEVPVDPGPLPQAAPAEPQAAPQRLRGGAVDLAGLGTLGIPSADLGNPIGGLPLDITTQIREKVASACTRMAINDRIEFGVGLTIAPSPDGQSMMPAAIVLLSIPSPIIGGPRIQVMNLVGNLWLNQGETDEMVHATLEQLREARTQIIGQNAVAAVAAQNGMPRL